MAGMAKKTDPVAALWDWLREDGGRTQADIAALLEVSPQSVWRWLHNRKRPNGEAAVRIEKRLGIPTSSWWAE